MWGDFNIYKLMHPTEYYEKTIQEIVEHYWEWLFPGYELIDTREYMRSTWKPDLFAINSKDGSFLIGELKVCGKIEQPFKQVARYGEEFLKCYTKAAVKLFVMGPWDLTKEKNFGVIVWNSKQDEDEDRSYEILYIAYQNVALYLLDFAEKSLECVGIDKFESKNWIRHIGFSSFLPLERDISEESAEENTAVEDHIPVDDFAI